MFAIDLIDFVIPPLQTSDPVRKAIDRMVEFRVRHLPIVNEDQFLGLLDENDIAGAYDDQTQVGALALMQVNPYVLEDQHIYDVIRMFYEHKLTVVPVLDADKNYSGLIRISALNDYFAKITSVEQPGGIIVLEINNKNNSLAHMAQIVEADNAQVLSSYIQSYPDSTRMDVTLKVNKQDISAIIATFLRYGYDIKATFNHTDGTNNSRDRYNSLMNYLNL